MTPPLRISQMAHHKKSGSLCSVPKFCQDTASPYPSGSAFPSAHHQSSLHPTDWIVRETCPTELPATMGEFCSIQRGGHQLHVAMSTWNVARETTELNLILINVVAKDGYRFLQRVTIPQGLLCLQRHSSTNSPCLLFLQNSAQGLPWWHSGWESACQCKGHGFKPWSGKIPHAAEQLSPCTTTTEPTL